MGSLIFSFTVQNAIVSEPTDLLLSSGDETQCLIKHCVMTSIHYKIGLHKNCKEYLMLSNLWNHIKQISHHGTIAILAIF